MKSKLLPTAAKKKIGFLTGSNQANTPQRNFGRLGIGSGQTGQSIGSTPQTGHFFHGITACMMKREMQIARVIAKHAPSKTRFFYGCVHLEASHRAPL